MSTETPVPPSVMWAQRKENVLLTFVVETKEPTIKIEKKSVYLKCSSVQDNKLYEVTIPLFDAVIPESSRYVVQGRVIEMVLRKEKSSFWLSLTPDKKKPHYLKIDFNKWKDEDDEDVKSDNEEVGTDRMMEQFLNDLAPGSESGKSMKLSKGMLEASETDSDDEDLPDLE